MPDPFITIGITAFNEGELLGQAWKSVLNQTDPCWECVLVLDGGATPDTFRIFDSLTHPQLRKIQMDRNVGPYSARSLAIKESRTSWYFHLDGDDLLPPEAVSLIHTALVAAPDADYLFGDSIHFSSTEELHIPCETHDPEEVAQGGGIIGQSPHTTALFERLDGFCKELHRGGADTDFWISALEAGARGYYVRGAIYKHRRRRNTISESTSRNKHNIAEIIISRHPRFFEVEKRRLLFRTLCYRKSVLTLRSLEKRAEAGRIANTAISLGLEDPIFRAILREAGMPYLWYKLRRYISKLQLWIKKPS